MSVKRKLIRADELILVTPAEAFHDSREPPLSIGDRVRLNSGGPPMLVVEREDNNLTVQMVPLGAPASNQFEPGGRLGVARRRTGRSPRHRGDSDLHPA
jgi:hypothetical protein